MLKELIAFRADSQLVGALAEQARRDGLTISEVIREAIRARIITG